MPDIDEALDERLITLLAQGLSRTAAAKIAGCHRTLIIRRLADPVFAARLVAVCIEASREAGRFLAASRLRAARVLRDLMHADKADAIRLAAAKTILEAGFQAVEAESFRQRLEAVERRQQGGEP